MEPERKIFIVELAEAVNRRPATIRQWERSGILPDSLCPKRSDRGWRYWSENQIQLIKDWMERLDLRPGKGLGHYNPSAETLAGHLEGQRRPRKNRAEREAATAAAST